MYSKSYQVLVVNCGQWLAVASLSCCSLDTLRYQYSSSFRDTYSKQNTFELMRIGGEGGVARRISLSWRGSGEGGRELQIGCV